ncbi:MAG: hypothetical protein WB919_00810 [Candidatus Sulfotelmatobacter sp.]
MPKPSSKDSLQPDVHDESSQSSGDTTSNVGMPWKIESVRSRFNAHVVGFGIVGPSTHTPNVGEYSPWNPEAAEPLGGKTMEDRK